MKHCTNDNCPLQNIGCNSDFPCPWSSQSFTTLGKSLTPLTEAQRHTAAQDPSGRKDPRSVPQRGLAAPVQSPHPVTANTHLHFLLCLLTLGGVHGLTGATSLALQRLDLLEKSSQGLFWGSWLPCGRSGKMKPRDTPSVLTWSLVCTNASSCSSDWPGPSFSLTEGGSAAAWASSSATCAHRKVSP